MILSMMIGVQGVGKSTFIEGYDTFAWVYSTDRYIEEQAKKEGKTYQEIYSGELQEEAGKVMGYGLARCFLERRGVIWDQTNTGVKKRREIIQEAHDNDYQVHGYLIHPSNNDQWSIIDERLANRKGKLIPDETTQSFRDSFEMPTLDEGFTKLFWFDINGILHKRITE